MGLSYYFSLGAAPGKPPTSNFIESADTVTRFPKYTLSQSASSNLWLAKVLLMVKQQTNIGHHLTFPAKKARVERLKIFQIIMQLRQFWKKNIGRKAFVEPSVVQLRAGAYRCWFFTIACSVEESVLLLSLEMKP